MVSTYQRYLMLKVQNNINKPRVANNNFSKKNKKLSDPQRVVQKKTI